MKSLFPEAGPLDSAETIAKHYEWPTDGQPCVRVNFVSSLDGGAWGHNKLSDSISTPSDREVFGVLRATCDAILVGSGTALAENYGPPANSEQQRASRANLYKPEPPKLAVVSGSGNIPSDAKMFDDPSNQPEIYASEDQAVKTLIGNGYNRILCEGGPHLFDSLISAGLVDEVCLTISPLLVGAGTNENPISRIVAGDSQLTQDVKLDLARLAVANDGTLLGIWQVKK
ncbi:MAG: dihydrofolate reductase family protein [Candidatus Nanopelagicales bacterium]